MSYYLPLLLTATGELKLSVNWKKNQLKILCLMKHYTMNRVLFFSFNLEPTIIPFLYSQIKIFFCHRKSYLTIVEVHFYTS